MGPETSDSDRDRAELFEALGHPTRIKILKALEKQPLGFSELKHSVGMESNGLLAFHLGKIGGFVKENTDGKYALTDYGIEALRLSYLLEKPASNNDGRSLRISKGTIRTHAWKLMVIATVLIAVLVVLAFVVTTYESRVVIVSPITILPVPNLPANRNFGQLSFVPFYNATTTGANSFYLDFKLNTTSFITGSFTSTSGIDIFILPKDIEGTFGASLYKGLGSATGFTFTTGPVANGTVDVTLTAGTWTLFVMDPTSQNSTLSILQPIRAISLCNTGPVCGPQ